jgi:hypothetical protein
VVEIPRHHHKGKQKPRRLAKSERERAEANGWEGQKSVS